MSDVERRLAESEERFRCLAQATTEGIVIHDGERILDANEQFAQIFGYTVDEVIGTKVGSRVAGKHKEAVGERSRGEDERPYQIEAFRKDRVRRTLEIRSRRIPYQGASARVAIVRDVTEHQRVEADVRTRQKMEAIGRLAAGVAHDFNNLLAVMLGRATLLAAHLGDDSELGSQAKEIVDVGNRAAGITQQLLAFGRQQPMVPCKTDLGEVVGGLRKMISRLMPETVALDLELAPDLDPVEVDPRQMERVIVNLAINAGDAMPDGGRLTIASERWKLEAAQAEALELEPGEYVRLSVRDTGCGMDAATRSRLFEPFYTTKDTGTGLGLSTVYGLVRQSGGAITVDSEPDVGSAFQVYLPMASKE